jgi:alpha-N-arabinofuranosidase
LDEQDEHLIILAVNRNQEGPLAPEADFRSLAGYEVVEHLVLQHEDRKAKKRGRAS